MVPTLILRSYLGLSVLIYEYPVIVSRVLETTSLISEIQIGPNVSCVKFKTHNTLTYTPSIGIYEVIQNNINYVLTLVKNLI